MTRRAAAVVAVVCLVACKEKETEPTKPAAKIEQAATTKESAKPEEAKPAAKPYARFKSGHYIKAHEKIFAKMNGAKGPPPDSDPMKIGGVRPMTRDDYGMAPMLADEGTRFLVPSLGPDNGGRIMSFSNAEDLAKMKAYYDDMKKTSAALFSWTATRHNLLLQMSGDMPEKQFHGLFEAVLDAVDRLPEAK